MRLIQERHLRQLVADNGWVVREGGLLLSSLDVQYPSFGIDRYPTLAHTAAAMMITVNHNHPLLDGNKRLSWYLTRTLVLINGADIRTNDDDDEALVLAVAAGELTFDELREEFDRRITGHQRTIIDGVWSLQPRTGTAE